MTWAPSAASILPIPDPRTWPAGVRRRFRELAGDCGPLDVCIFTSGHVASMYLQDAITAVGIFDVDPSGWHAEDGYPAFHFDARDVEEYSRRLTACGYTVRVVALAGNGAETAGNTARRAEVVEISSARREKRPSCS
jgi:hypothetical protein